MDLDGTLADCSHRLHHIRDFDLDCGHAGGIDWNAFYRACVHDKPILPVINVMRALRSSGARIEIWTGRSDLVRAETCAWFVQHGIPQTKMIMRPHGDHCRDSDLKQRWLYECGEMPDIVFEDRARVVQMFRDEGVRVAQVAPGDF